MPVPNRGSGTSPGWVHPTLVQWGTQIVKRSTGAPVRLKGVCISDQDGSGYPDLQPAFYNALLSSMPGLNFLDLHMKWFNIEPSRPTGGNPNPVSGPPTWTSRDYTSSGQLAAVDAFLSAMDALGNVYVKVNFSGNGGGIGGDPMWLYDDAQWASAGLLAPMPYDRTAYGGPYGTNAALNGTDGVIAAGSTVFNTAGTTIAAANVGDSITVTGAGQGGTDLFSFIDIRNTAHQVVLDDVAGTSVSGATFQVGPSLNTQGTKDVQTAIWTRQAATCKRSLDNRAWHGDSDKRFTYYQDLALYVQAMVSKHPCVIAMKYFNEPNFGDLASNANYGSPLAATNAILLVEKLFFDAIRAQEPERMLCVAGRGGPSYQVSPDFTQLWAQTQTLCPDDHPLAMEWHDYQGGQQQGTPPYDVVGENQSSDGTTYAPHRDANGKPDYIVPLVNAVSAAAVARGMPLIVGEFGVKTNVTGNSAFVADRAAMYNGASQRLHYAYFNGGFTVLPGCMIPSGVTYVLNSTTGPQVAAMIAQDASFVGTLKHNTEYRKTVT